MLTLPSAPAAAAYHPSPLQVFGTKKRMSAVAVLDVAGVDDLFEMVLQLALEGRLAWEAKH